MDQFEINEKIAELRERGFEIDEGNLIDGPWIPDGTIRIYRVSDNNLYICASSVEEALNRFSSISYF